VPIDEKILKNSAALNHGLEGFESSMFSKSLK
jgi:hypothetical protein